MRARTPVAFFLALMAVAASGCAAGVASSRPVGSVSPAASGAASEATTPALGPFPSDLVQGMRTEVDVAYTGPTDCGGTPCSVPGDVIAPSDGNDMPTIVMLGGGSTAFAERRYQERLAVGLAERGAVVFLMAYRSAVTGSYDSDSYNDVRCAVRYARVTTEEYGGDPSRIVAVGHSQGGLIALELAIQPEAEAEACLADGSGKPDAIVALGSPPPSFVGAGDSAPPIWLFAGSEDRDAEGIAQRLRGHGFNAQARELPGVTHDGIVDPIANPEVLTLIFEALESIQSRPAG